MPIVKLSVFGKSEQNRVPTTENPASIVSAGESGNIEVKITGKNLINVSEEAISISYDVGSYTIKNGVIAFNTVNNWGGDYLYFNDIDVSRNKELVFQMEATLPEKQDTETNGAKILVKAYNELGEEIKDPESVISNDTWKMAYNNHYKGLTYYRRGSNISIKFSNAVAKIKVGVAFLDEIAEKPVIIRDYQVEYGTTPTAYEPYKEQTTTLQTPNGLLGLKVDVNGNYTDENGQQWIADEIDLARGKYVQRIAKYVFDGSEALADNIGSSTSYFLKVNDVRSNTGMCNYGKRIPITGQKQEELTFSVDDSGIYLYTTKAVNEFKNLLKQKYDSGKPVEVLYALKTPIETDLPPEALAAFDQLHTNYPNTIVSNNADAGMELTYTVDTQSYIDSKIAEVSKALL